MLLIIDGLGDLPITEFEGLTPLESARTPVLDRLAAQGRCGLVDPIGPGIIPNTHSGCGLLLGIEPGQVPLLRRGPIEASGAGWKLEPGEVAMRANFASARNDQGTLILTDRRAGRISQGTDQLAEALQDVDLGDGVRANLLATDQHRGALILSGSGLSEAIRRTDPGDIDLPAALEPCAASDPAGQFTAGKLNRFLEIAHHRLEHHPVNRQRRDDGLLPANVVITRGAGEWFELDNVFSRRDLDVSLVAGCNTVRGLGTLFGYSTPTDPLFTADLDTDLPRKMTAAIDELEQHDMAYIHVKAPDICAHDLNPAAKRGFIERLDAALEILVKSNCVIAVTADHSTDSNTGFHTADPVPSLIYDPSAPESSPPHRFGENACRAGSLPRQTAQQFVEEVVRVISG